MFSYFWGRNASLPLALLYVLLGLLLTIFPDLSGTIFVWALAGVCLVFAIARLWRYYQRRKADAGGTGDLIAGIAALILALFFWLWPHVVLSFLPLVLGILLLLDGVGKLPLVMDARRAGLPLPLPLLLSTLAPLVLGIILIADPFGVTRFVIRFFGISLIVDGVCDCLTLLSSRPRE